jgi:preprotein translocase subunit SecA
MSALRDRVRRFLQKPGTADLSGYQRLLPAIAAAEAELADLPDEALPAEAAAAAETETQAGQARFCAVGREAARRALGERPYDAQLLGALVMMSGSVAEMATGEGKTLAGALAAAWHATRGGPVHVMAVNDYLARRDAEWMGPVYQALGVSVGFLGSASATAERRAAYAAQVTYAPVSEIGFDVLRDRLRTDPADQVMTAPDVVLIDEADSVLIDEALVPLVLAGAGEAASTDLRIAGIVRGLRPGRHYEADDEARNVQLTDAGARAAEAALGGIDLYAEAQLDFLTRLNLALHAQVLLRRDVDYIVRDGRIQLISTSRGRVARLQRWPDGLHAAVEAKEGLAASETGEILDSITVESLVRRYPKVCGMTATAVTIGEQLREFYGLEVAVIAPNRPSVREDEPDRLYATRPAKERGVIAEIAAAHSAGRPVLIGTLDIAESERVAAQLAAADLPCVVLNAKNDAEEAAIISEAGARGAITVSTQMAGRGTDIRLGGRQGDEGQVAGLGGLHVVGTGRHWTERIDRQLRGRAGRQGDPGRSVFFVSMEDDLVVSYPLHEAPGGPDPDGRLDDARSRRAVRHAQRAAEAANLEIHRNTFRYSKLIEEQRRVVLERRDRVLHGDAALTDLARRCPDRYQELAAEVGPGVLEESTRQIALYHLDRGWADHLAVLAEIREGIHLRALGHGPNPFIMALDPLAEFHAEAVKLFGRLLEQIGERCAATFEAAAITSAGIDLAAADLKRPTATWTYVVQDNPFGSDAERAGRRLRGLMHGASG